MKKLLLLASLLCGGLLNAQVYPFYEGFDGVTTSGSPATGPLPAGWTTGTGSQFMVYGVENLQGHGWSAPNACSVEMKSTHVKDSLTTPAIGPISGNTKISLSYRFVDKTNYPTTGHQLTTGDVVTIDAFVGTNGFPAIATIDMNTNPVAMTTWTTYTYTNALFAFAGANPCKMRLDVAWGSGDWYLDIDNVIVADVVTGISYSAFNPPSVTVSPNPASGYFYLWVKDLSKDEPVTIKMFNELGEMTKSIRTAETYYANQFKIETEGMARGVYMVEVSSKNGVSKTKVVVE